MKAYCCCNSHTLICRNILRFDFFFFFNLAKNQYNSLTHNSNNLYLHISQEKKH